MARVRRASAVGRGLRVCVRSHRNMILSNTSKGAGLPAIEMELGKSCSRRQDFRLQTGSLFCQSFRGGRLTTADIIPNHLPCHAHSHAPRGQLAVHERSHVTRGSSVGEKGKSTDTREDRTTGNPRVTQVVLTALRGRGSS